MVFVTRTPHSYLLRTSISFMYLSDWVMLIYKRHKIIILNSCQKKSTNKKILHLIYYVTYKVLQYKKDTNITVSAFNRHMIFRDLHLFSSSTACIHLICQHSY